MFHTAVSRHEKENAKEPTVGQTQVRTLNQTLFSSSPRSQSHLVQGGGLQKQANALRPSSASTLNRWRDNDERRRNGFGNVVGVGVKRTASGLAKVTDGSFDDVLGVSKDQPIEIAEGTGHLPQINQSEFFNVDDFDSDLELDVEEPIARSCAVKYPALPQAPLQKPFKVPASRPQPQPRPHTNGASAFVKKQQQQYSTSNPVPWSSSPIEHLQPMFSASRSSTAQQHETAHQRPSKRRTLPWDGDDTQEGTSDAGKGIQSFTTPASKRDGGPKFLWNTTASSIKAQQKTHREETKKSSAKAVDGTEDSIMAAKVKRRKPARVFLSEEQQHVLELVTEKKKSVFFTGSAGTGKSVLLREIISTLRRKFQREPDRVAVTASTGLAACNVGGVTLHSFAGIGLGKEDVPELVRKIKKN
ncbi:hypothetical protein K431DRAFT_227894, partial [Polychaeton citri CBS 116435]